MVGGDGYFMLFFTRPGGRFASVALGDSGGLWGHLVDTVLATYVINTLLLMGGVGSVAIVFGVSSAWVISRYDFVGRDMLEWMLPTGGHTGVYHCHCYTDFFEYAGPVQSALRAAFGWQSPRDYFFPEIRSVGGGGIGHGIGALSLCLHGDPYRFSPDPGKPV